MIWKIPLFSYMSHAYPVLVYSGYSMRSLKRLRKSKEFISDGGVFLVGWFHCLYAILIHAATVYFLKSSRIGLINHIQFFSDCCIMIFSVWWIKTVKARLLVPVWIRSVFGRVSSVLVSILHSELDFEFLALLLTVQDGHMWSGLHRTILAGAMKATFGCRVANVVRHQICFCLQFSQIVDIKIATI